MTKVVKFVKPFSVYAVGDIAGLTDKEAEEAIEADAAVPYKEEKQKAEIEVNAEKKSIDAPKENKQVENPVVKK